MIGLPKHLLVQRPIFGKQTFSYHQLLLAEHKKEHAERICTTIPHTQQERTIFCLSLVRTIITNWSISYWTKYFRLFQSPVKLERDDYINNLHLVYLHTYSRVLPDLGEPRKKTGGYVNGLLIFGAKTDSKKLKIEELENLKNKSK